MRVRPTCCTHEGISDYNIHKYTCEEDIQNLRENFLNVLILEGSCSNSIHSNNIPHLYNGFLVPPKEYGPVNVKINH
jgi:hypothetical protein